MERGHLERPKEKGERGEGRERRRERRIKWLMFSIKGAPQLPIYQISYSTDLQTSSASPSRRQLVRATSSPEEQPVT